MGSFNDFIKKDFDPSTAQTVHLGSSTYQVVPSPDNNVYFKGSVSTDEDGNKVVNGDFYVYSGKSMKQLNMDATDFDNGLYVTQSKEQLAQKDLNSLIQPSWETISVQQDVRLGMYKPPVTNPDDIFEKMRNEGRAEDRELNAIIQEEEERKKIEEIQAQKNANVDQGIDNILDFPPGSKGGQGSASSDYDGSGPSEYGGSGSSEYGGRTPSEQYNGQSGSEFGKPTITADTADKNSIWQGPPQRPATVDGTSALNVQSETLSSFSTAISASANSPYSNRYNSIYSIPPEKVRAGQIRYKVSDTTWMATRAASDMVTKQLIKATNTQENPEMAAGNFYNTVTQTRTYASLARTAGSLLVGEKIVKVRELAYRQERKEMMKKYGVDNWTDCERKISQRLNEQNIRYAGGKYSNLQLMRIDMKLSYRIKRGDAESLLAKQEKMEGRLSAKGKSYEDSFSTVINRARQESTRKYQDKHFVSSSLLGNGISREELVSGGLRSITFQRDTIHDAQKIQMLKKTSAKGKLKAQFKKTQKLVKQTSGLVMNQLGKTEAGQGLATTTKVVRLASRSVKTAVTVSKRTVKMASIIAKKTGIARIKNKIAVLRKQNKINRLNKKIGKAGNLKRKSKFTTRKKNVKKYGRGLKGRRARFKRKRKLLRKSRRKKLMKRMPAPMRKMLSRMGGAMKKMAKPFKAIGKAMKAVSHAFTIVKVWIGIIIAIIALIIILLAAYENTMVQQYAGALDINGSTGVLKGEEDEDIVADDEEDVTAEDFEEITEEETGEAGED